MNILVLEDNPARIKSFKYNLIGSSTTFVSTADEFREQVQQQPFDAIFLDHDLHEFGTPIEQSGTGMDAVRHLVDTADQHSRTMVVIHSLNKAKAEEMYVALAHAGLGLAVMANAWVRDDLLAWVSGIIKANR